MIFTTNTPKTNTMQQLRPSPEILQTPKSQGQINKRESLILTPDSERYPKQIDIRAFTSNYDASIQRSVVACVQNSAHSLGH